MIEISDRNIYEVLRPDLFIPGTKLLGKHQLWRNTATDPQMICFRKDFHSYDSDGFDHGNDVWFGFNPEEKTLELHCSSYGGMCGFVFSEDDLKDKHTDLDRQCMGFAINLVKALIAEGVIKDSGL